MPVSRVANTMLHASATFRVVKRLLEIAEAEEDNRFAQCKPREKSHLRFADEISRREERSSK